MGTNKGTGTGTDTGTNVGIDTDTSAGTSADNGAIEETLQGLETMSTRFFTVAEVAGFMRISYYSVWRLVIAKKIVATKMGGQWRIPRISLIVYLRSKA